MVAIWRCNKWFFWRAIGSSRGIEKCLLGQNQSFKRCIDWHRHHHCHVHRCIANDQLCYTFEYPSAEAKRMVIDFYHCMFKFRSHPRKEIIGKHDASPFTKNNCHVFDHIFNLFNYWLALMHYIRVTYQERRREMAL
jgi:hypothetical protein